MSPPAFVATFDALREAAAYACTPHHPMPPTGGEDQKKTASSVSTATTAPSPVSVAYQHRQARTAATLAAPPTTTPRDEVLRLGSLVGSLCASILNHAPPDGSESMSFWSTDSPAKTEIAASMGSVFLALFVMANVCGVDLRVCILKKMELNGKKYPVELCKGKSGKYTEYSTTTGFTTDHRSQSTVDDDDAPAPAVQGDDTVQGLTLRIRKFATDRSWSQYHTPRNIVLALMGELGELAELFQWRGDDSPPQEGAGGGLAGWDEQDIDHVSQELADVSIYLLRLADVCEVDLGMEALGRC